MRIRAIGRHLVVKMQTDRIEKKTASGIVLTGKTVESEEGGVQFSTVLDVGQYAFDDQPDMAEIVKPGVTIVTCRYPGNVLYTKPDWKDKNDVPTYRLILDTEVRAVADIDEGAEIDE